MTVLFDPDSAAVRDDPYPAYCVLRQEAPAYRHPELGFCAVSRYDDVKAALLAPGRLSSERSFAQDGMDPVAAMPIMVILDPPRHDQLRSLVNRAFTPRRIAALEKRIREIATDLVGEFAEEGRCDLWRDLAAPLPTTVIAELLGIPASDHAFFKAKSTEIASSVTPGEMPSGPTSSAGVELARYLASQFTEKRKKPGDDLLSALLAAEIEGERLTEAERIGFAILLLIAGNETTTNWIANTALLLDRHADARALLAREPVRLPIALEEALRFDPPLQGLERVAREDLTIAGENVAKGEKLLLLLASANRDEQRFEDAARFDIARTPNAHLSFGLGTHFCLGASLARLEARIAWEELLRRVPDFAIKGPVERLPSSVFRGVLSVPVEFPVQPDGGRSRPA